MEFKIKIVLKIDEDPAHHNQIKFYPFVFNENFEKLFNYGQDIVEILLMNVNFGRKSSNGMYT